MPAGRHKNARACVHTPAGRTYVVQLHSRSLMYSLCMHVRLVCVRCAGLQSWLVAVRQLAKMALALGAAVAWPPVPCLTSWVSSSA